MSEKLPEILREAIDDDDVEGVRAALAAGADPNLCSIADSTPLWRAIGKNADITALLLAAKADPNRTVESGLTPLHKAVRIRHFSAAEFLLEGGANPNLRASGNATALHVAFNMDLRDETAERVTFLATQMQVSTDVLREVREIAVEETQRREFAKYLLKSLDTVIDTREKLEAVMTEFRQREIASRLSQASVRSKGRYKL